MKFSLLFCMFILLLFHAKDSTAQTQTIKFNLVSGTNGVSLGKINSVTRDIHGVMWLSDQTNRCLTRYDGNRITRFQNDPKNTNSLGGTYPECVNADNAGIIWVGFYGTGLDRFDPETQAFTHYRHKENDKGSLSNDTVTAILIDHQGMFWVATYGGLDLLDVQTGKFKHFSHQDQDSTSLSYNKVRALYEDREGTIWVGTGFPWDNNDEGGLNRFDRNTGKFTRYLHDPANSNTLINNKVRSIFEDSRGNFWIGTMGDGLHTMDRKTGLFKRYGYNPANPSALSRLALKRGDDHITFITEDANKNLWLGTFANGLIMYDPLTKKLTHFGNNADKSGEFKDNSGWLAYPSSDGFLWVSTQENNLYRIDLYTNSIPYFKTDSNFVGVHAFYKESANVLWCGTDSGLVRKDIKNGTAIKYINEPGNSNSISNNVVLGIVKDKQGDFWLTTNRGLNRFNPVSKKITRYLHNPNDNKSLGNDLIYKQYLDHQSNLYISTFGFGFDLLNTQTGKFTHYKNSPTDTNSLSKNFTSAFLEDETNDIWVGTWGNGGINRLNRQSGKFKHYLPDANVSSIINDADGIIWVSTENGLYRYNRKSDDFSLWDEGYTGFAINDIHSMIADKQNNIWIASQIGIYRLSQKRDQLISYGRANGVVTQYMHYGTAHKGEDGELFFGDVTGYFAFYPEKLHARPGSPIIELTSFWLNGQVVKPANGGLLHESLYKAKEIHLPHDQNVFSFSFNAIDYGNSEDKVIYYKLENYDKEWRQPSSELRVYYFNIPPGKYTLRIKAANRSNGIWAEKVISIIITPPWWSTWWAYCLYGLLLFAIAYSFHRIQKERVIKAERERTRERELAQAKEIEKAYLKLSTTQTQLIQSEKMASLGELTAGIAHEIQNPLNFVNNFSDLNTELIDELLEERKKEVRDFKIEDDLLNSLKENEQKINQHGRRADAIVKGMLQHSRSSNGIKESTDINALADEYLRLCYHGLRAKDKSFNASMKTDFDESIGKINIIPQDVGRVVLNLLTNAFYAASLPSKGGLKDPTYKHEPTVTMKTSKNPPLSSGGRGAEILISVSDNGPGIPPKTLEKIFNPFFTTKPSGQGTGLGLSLSYDIITKGHGGQIKVETKEGEGSTFTIHLPV